ncbi:accessory gene regulator ArgB-like protein [Fusibacter sp. JL216-2]|uniref:accessory gene regulator ArgB-like protein n=1 Tax=Fusibacter sp. JL216-2 TaxID=3071453 RepID=UPI003D32CD88
MINQMSREITRSLIKNDIISFDDMSVYQYGLEVLFLTTIKLIGIFILASLFGYVIESVLFIIAFGSLRMYAGGYHAKTVFKCFILTIGFIIADILTCSLISINKSPILIFAITLISFTIVYILSPVAVKSRPITVDEQRKFRESSIKLMLVYLVIITVLVIKQSYLWYVGIFSLGLFFEATTLLAEKLRKENW